MKLGEIGDTLAERYQLREALGGGALSEVFAAWDVRLRRNVAVKVFDSTCAPKEKLAKLAEMLDRASGVRHAAVVLPRIQVELDKSPPFHVGEIVPGEDLGTFADRVGLVPWQRALELVETCAEGLAALAEETGAAHRDLKPGNIRILPDGSARVLDFGVAELGVLPVPPGGSSAVEYRAPEQLQGFPGDTSSDVFSLGALLFQLVTGIHPFSGATAFKAAHKILTLQSAPRVSEVAPHVVLPSQVEGLLGRMLARWPADRFGDAVELGRHIALVRRSPGITPRGRGSAAAPSSEHEEITTPLKRIEFPDALTTAVRVPLPHIFKKAPPAEADRSLAFSLSTPESVPEGPRLLGAGAVPDDRTEVFTKSQPPPRAERTAKDAVSPNGTEVFSRPNVLPRLEIAPGSAGIRQEPPDVPEDRTVRVPRLSSGESPPDTTLEVPGARPADLRAIPGNPLVNTPTMPLTQLDLRAPPLISTPITAVQQLPVFDRPSPKVLDSTPRPIAPPQLRPPQRVAREPSVSPTAEDAPPLKNRLITTNLMLGLLIVLGLIVLALLRTR